MAATKDARGRKKVPEIKRYQSKYKVEPDIWMPNLPEVDLNFTRDQKKVDHVIALGEVYVAVRDFFDLWRSEEPVGDLVPDLTGFKAVQPSKMRIDFEVDLGNMEVKRLMEKVMKYVRYFPKPDQKAVFLLRSGKYNHLEIGKGLLDEFTLLHRGNQFTIASLDRFLEDPYARIIVTPKGEKLTLQELCST